VLKEMVRVTKPKGIVIIVDYDLPDCKIGRYLIYRFVRSYESKYYPEFINSEPGALLEKSGIETKEGVTVIVGAVRILRGINHKNSKTVGKMVA
jgi:ubiquinone/menaquinone biosynthesis C-methylase UbiE